MSRRTRILVATLNAAARVGCWLLETFAPSVPPEGAWHPSMGPEAKPAPIEPRPLTDDEHDAAYEEHLAAQVRALLVDRAGWEYPASALIDLATCEAIGELPVCEDHQ